MASKANKNRDDGPTLSSSISYSPYNLRRNQPQAGNSLGTTRVSTNNTTSSTPQVTLNASQLSSSEDE
ncbi:unnamed protein product [Rotaria magnacalcarata]|uniref:Uncharacterized protein n=1 Tax=Rotaria magnacalcarata TaxID=392030 RepID=A0A8S2TYF7_9BILA|nr:unnamed protein product [Rotaria magnacalcarata]CAF5140663.1 unnamed protein product [Rotaria magnacalcarata]